MARQRAQAEAQPVATSVGTVGLAGEAQTVTARGSLAAIQCSGKTATLIVKAEDGSFLRLLIDDPTKVTLEGAPGGSFDFSCGVQKPLSVEVEFFYDRNVTENGVLRVLRFVKRKD